MKFFLVLVDQHLQKIQDVLNAEVTLAENRILLVNALAEFTLASYRVRALTHGLTKEIGWKTF